MSKIVQVFLYITIIVVSLSIIGIVILLMPDCTKCGQPFHLGDCEQVGMEFTFGDDGDKEEIRVNPIKVSQNTTRLVQTNPADDDYIEKITFIGDSRTVALTLHGIDERRVFAANSLTHEQALTYEVVSLNDETTVTIEEAVLATAPDIAIINFGINGAAWMDNETFITGYRNFLDTLLLASPSTIFVIESILPVSANYELREDGISNERIDELNDLLYDLAVKRGVFYLASNEALKGDNNALNPLYDNDGLHFSSAAYVELLNYIKTHAIYRE